MERRDFLRSVFRVLSFGAVASFLYPAVKFLYPRSASARYSKLRVKKDTIPAGTAYKTRFNNKQIIILHDPAKGYIALSRVCTHLGCLVDYDRSVNRLICPCHGANFTVDGRVISGPPPKPLERLPLVVKGKWIVVG